jgi:hypothetical protein
MGRSVPVIPTEVPGNFNTSALFNAAPGALGSFLLGPPRFAGYQTAAQSVASGTWAVAMLIDTEVVDSDSGHSTTTNTSRYTVQVAGLYLVGVGVGWPANATGARAAVPHQNGASLPGGPANEGAPTSSSNSWAGQAWAFAQANVGDYFECTGFQQSGSTLSTNGAFLYCLWISQ